MNRSLSFRMRNVFTHLALIALAISSFANQVLAQGLAAAEIHSASRRANVQRDAAD
jgi:hypothetical protein